MTFVRRETTIGFSLCDPYLSPDYDESWLEVLDDYVRQNSIKRTLRPLFAFKLLASEEIDNAFRDLPYGDWTRFFKEIDRNGYAVVSAVGFDKAKTRAIVYSARHCGGTCGKGMHTAWQKRGGCWEPALVLSRNVNGYLEEQRGLIATRPHPDAPWGANVADIQELLGHKSPKNNAKIRDGHTRKARERFTAVSERLDQESQANG
jgi:hypothetical protein